MIARRAGRNAEAGATSVEFAIVLPIFLTLIAAVLVLGLAMFYAGLAEVSARVGLREAVIRTSAGYPDEARVRAVIDSGFKGLLPKAQTATGTLLVRNPADAAASPRGSQGDRVTVTVEYSIPAITSALKLIPDVGLRTKMTSLVTVDRKAEGRLE